MTEELAELQRYKAALVWLEDNKRDLFGVSVIAFGKWLIRKTSGDVQGNTLLEAIEQAM